MIFIKLFWSFFQVGLFSFGGGYATLPLIHNQAVDINKWLTLTEFTDLITISQTTPGPIAINTATFVGIRVAGILGAIVATLGFVTPACVIVSFLFWFYYKYKNLKVMQGILKGLRPAVVGLIASAGVSVLALSFNGEQGLSLQKHSLDIIAVVIFSVSIFILKKWKPNPIYVILGSGAFGGALYLFVK